jgi:hypothetical protein
MGLDEGLGQLGRVASTWAMKASLAKLSQL